MRLTNCEKIIFNFLKKFFVFEILKENYKILNGKRFVFLPPSVLEKEFELSAYQQRNLLNRLLAIGLIDIKFGQQRKRYFSTDEPEKNDVINLQREIKLKLKRINDKQSLEKILQIIRKCENANR